MTKTRVRGVYKHKSGGYIARLRRKGVSISRTFASLTSAERWITQTRIGLDDGDLVIRDGEVLSKNEAQRQERILATCSLILVSTSKVSSSASTYDHLAGMFSSLNGFNFEDEQ